ncbi:flagellar hook-associated protein [Campylobacter avium LMG 24591]|uniref:Flagellar hook-associated protein 1 n=1 Tax=Campylobacter avium LMG 24591 TaxID=522484 RepID=A0A222MZ67_9BACT|nr:flagellar hook-associated protein FlgK [Campylobacter avium]ASQ30896.1 flagellar hook-associated protein [Campylobacter avium LMG 24591]OYD78707.1 flagellar hook-associated protein [Campylobacter avium]
MSIFATLSKGVSGLKASELQISTTSNNISNVGSTFYTRQRAVQTTAGYYNSYGGVELGMGTTIESIVRLHDEYSYLKLKDSTTQLEYTNYMKTKLEEIAKRFPDIQTNGILADLEAYNAAWNSFSTSPNDSAVKENLITVAKTLTNHINDAYADMMKIEQAINEDIALTVDEINRIAKEIANINNEISKQESLPTDTANELRDRRDELEMTLSKLVGNVATKTIMEQNSRLDSTMTDKGTYYNLSISGVSIVNGSTFTPLKIMTDEVTNSHKVVVQGIDEKILDLTGRISGGKLGAQLDLRGREFDTSSKEWSKGSVQEYKNMLDTFAKTMITHTNNIYAASAKSSVSSDYYEGLRADTVLMNYDKNVQIGSFDIVIYDEAGLETSRKTINIDVNTTMQDIINQISSNTDDDGDLNNLNDVDDYVSAIFSTDSKTNSGQFQISLINPGFKIAIEDNGTNFPGAFNVGGFFSGTDATSMSVKSEYLNDPSLLRGSKNGSDGDNDISNQIIQLQYEELNFYNADGTVNKVSIDGYYRLFTGRIASDGEAVTNTHSTNTTLYNTVYDEFQSKNGVSTNEELAALIQFQSSYGAAAKVVTTVDQMLDTLLGLKQ